MIKARSWTGLGIVLLLAAPALHAQPGGGTAVLSFAVQPRQPLPVLAVTESDLGLEQMLYMHLTQQALQNGRIVEQTSAQNPMALARRWSFTGRDSTEIRYVLRRDARWSDGRPITAADVVYTYGLLEHPSLAAGQKSIAALVERVRAEGDSAVTIRFRGRAPGNVHASDVGIVPRHVYGTADPATLPRHPAITAPAGRLVTSGPFRVTGWENGTITLTRNPAFRPTPRLERIVIRVQPDDGTRLVELQTGAVDFGRVRLGDLDALRRRVPGLQVYRQRNRAYDFIVYNPRAHPALADPEVRRALGQAIDTRRLLRALDLVGFASPAGGPYSPFFRELYDPAAQRPLAYDPARAARILDARGWAVGPDGIRRRGGQRLALTLLTHPESPRRRDAAVVVQAAWKAIGVDAQIQMMEQNALLPRLTAHQFDAAIFGWNTPTDPDLGPIFGPDQPFNFGSFDDAAARLEMERGRAATSEAAANRHWRSAASRIALLQPYTFLYYTDIVRAGSPRLRGVRVTDTHMYGNSWEWWVAGSARR
jgi:peptide/nickel transport system substrate-binding protein